MFKKIAFVLIVLSLALSACTINGHTITIDGRRIAGSGNIVNENRPVSGFDKVELKGIGNLTITTGDQESLIITADDNLMEYITTEVFNETLEIGMEPNLSLDPTRSIEYTLTVKDLNSVVLAGFGNIVVDEISTEDAEIKVSGSGDIAIGSLKSENGLLRVSGFGDIEVDEMVVDQPTLEITGSGNMTVDQLQAVSLEVRISGFGNADLKGTTNKQNIELLGSGDFVGDDLESEETSIKITGFGNGTVWATEILNVTITGSGNLDYFGNPKVTQTMTGFGKVNSLGDR